MSFDIFTVHHSIFSFLYYLFGPESYVSPLTIFCAVWLPWVLLLVPFVYELYKNEEFSIWRTLWKFYLTPICVYLLTILIKFYYHTPRPFALLEIPPAFVVASDPYGLASFPSSHTAVFFALAVVVYLHDHKIGKWLLWGALAIGIARIGAGVHWPIDILGGLLLGIGVAFFFEKALPIFFKKHDS
jgi:membrane-associated phospholipid phosphatase